MVDIRVMREDFLPPRQPPKRHLISIDDVTRDDVERCSAPRDLERPRKRGEARLADAARSLGRDHVLRVVDAACFASPAKRLSADTMSLKSSGSAVDKGDRRSRTP